MELERRKYNHNDRLENKIIAILKQNKHSSLPTSIFYILLSEDRKNIFITLQKLEKRGKVCLKTRKEVNFWMLSNGEPKSEIIKFGRPKRNHLFTKEVRA